jgi:hypothetical protein
MFTKRYFMKAYDLEEEDFEVVSGTPVQGGEPPAEFSQAPGATASSTGAPVDALAAALTPEQLQGIAGKLLAPVLDLVESAASVEDIAERLHGVYPDMDDTTFEDLLMRAIFVASVWGGCQHSESKEAGALKRWLARHPIIRLLIGYFSFYWLSAVSYPPHLR